MKRRCCFLLASLVALAFAADQDQQRTQERQDVEMVNVIVGYKDPKDGYSTMSHEEWKGWTLKSEFKRTKAITMTIPASQVASLQNDEIVDYVAINDKVEPYSETIPWGIPAVQANSPAIPLPDPVNNGDCFKICIVDSGVYPNHPDLPNFGSNIYGAEFGLGGGVKWNNPTSFTPHGTSVAGILLAQGGNNEGAVGVIPNNQKMCLLVARVFDESQWLSADTSNIDKAVEWCADSGARVINMSLGSPYSNPNSRLIHESMEEEGILVVAAAGNSRDTSTSYPAGYPQVMSVASVAEDYTKSDFSQSNSQVDISAPGEGILAPHLVMGIIDESGAKYETDLMAFSPLPPTTGMSGNLHKCGEATSTCSGASNKICLIKRGDGDYTSKATNCENGGGIGAIIYNSAGESGMIWGALALTYTGTIPVFVASYADGVILEKKNRVTIDTRVPDYAVNNGTSTSAPFVAGIAAKAWAARPNCTLQQIRDALLKTARDLGPAGRDNSFGYGLVQAADAYKYLLSLPAPCGESEELNNGSTPSNVKGPEIDLNNKVYVRKNRPKNRYKDDVKFGLRGRCRGCRERRYLKGSGGSSSKNNEMDE